MGKTPITWIGLVTLKSNELKKAGDTGGLSKAIKESKSMWAEIKAGNNSTYEQGKATRKVGKKSKKSKTEKKGKKSVSAVAGSVDTNNMLKECKVCKKCLKKLEKYLKKHGSCHE
jgi:hypothetical protein